MKSIINKKLKKVLSVILTVVVTGSILRGQHTAVRLKFTLKEAQEYAVQNNKMMISSKYDIEASRAAIWETISTALPQVSLSGSFTDNLKLMTTLLPGEFFGRPGEYIPVTFGQKFNTSASVQASMLLFNAPLYIGIQTTKLANSLSEKSSLKTELDTREGVATTYYLILVSERSLGIIDQNITNLQGTLKSTKSMLAAGMAEQTDVDQMASNLTMVVNSKSSLERTIEVNYNLLRFQLGVPPETSITLSQDLESLLNEVNVQALLSQEFDLNRNIDYALVTDQQKISALSVKSSQASVLPSLAGFYNYGTNGMGQKVSDQRWFPNSMVGLQLSVPILASGQRYSQIKRAKINLDKATNTREMVAEQLLIQEKQLRYNLVNANQQYLSQKENVEVSRRVYESTENKFSQGMASSLDLTQANSLYLQAENNYISSLMNLLQTKLALDKLLNNM
ncbi:MAG TPA: TolC family protein [Bacteroidales bacterium]|nr:TolC family protein [Bacteroidales bacterium]